MNDSSLPPADTSADTTTSSSAVPPSRSFVQSPFAVALVVGAVFGAFTFWRIHAGGNDVSRFITAGRRWVQPSELPAKIALPDDPKSVGYDGQFYYRLALNPLTRQKVENGIEIDSPAYRQQRILLPGLAWLLARGKAARIPLAIVLVNWACVCAIGLTAALYARALRVSVWWGLPLALYPGFLLTISRDLTEVIGICFLLIGMLLLRRGYFALSTVAFFLSILGRDTAVFASGAIGLVWIWEQAVRRGWVPERAAKWIQANSDQTPPIPFYVPVVPVALYIGWITYLRSVWGQFPFQEYAKSGNNMAFLFKGLFGFLFSRFFHLGQGSSSTYEHLWLNECLLLILVTVTALCFLRRTQASLSERTTWLIYVVLASFYGTTIWEEDYGFLRILSDVWILSMLLVIATRFRLKPVYALAALYTFWMTLQSFTIR